MARAFAVPTGVIDLASGAMLLALASGQGILAPTLLGGFATALAVGAAGAVTLGLARRLRSPQLALAVIVSAARLAAVVGQVLVLLSQTGVAAVVGTAIASVVLTIGLLVPIWVVIAEER